jgi:DNA-directed RNA polymerase specialized sigma24 family protein/LysM repeat protein
MYTPRSELAPDLDWMLQSAQVSDEALAETLIRDYAGRLAQLATSILHTDQAMAVVQHTLTRAVLDRRHYWGKGSARAWLYGLALRACQQHSRAPKPRLTNTRQLAARFTLPPLTADPHLTAVTSPLDPAQALMLYLTVGQGLSADDIAYLLKTPGEQVQAQLHAIGDALDQHRQHCPECALRPGGLADLEGRLRSVWQGAASEGSLSPPVLQRLQAEVLSQVSGQRRARQARSHLPELALVGALMAAMFAMGWLSNGFWAKPGARATASPSGPLPATPEAFFHYSVKPGDTLDSIAQKAGTSVNLILFLNLLPPQTVLSPGQLLNLPASQPRPSRMTPAPFTPAPPLALLTWQSSLHDIQQRINGSQGAWHSLWADVLNIQYGPPGYVGQPQSITRKQVWILQPAYTRVIYGSADTEPSGTYVIVAGHVYGQDLNSQRVYEDLTSDLVIDLDLQKLFVPGDVALNNGQFSLAGQEPVADRTALMLDWRYTNGGRIYRFWVDAQTGVILRRREYGGANFSAVLNDITVASIAFDVDMPLTLFDPQAYKGDQFAADYTGAPATAALQPAAPQPTPLLPTTPLAGHEALPLLTPPPGFDPAYSRLTLERHPPADANGASVDVFADRYYLGRLAIDTASILACRRSPDGRQIAFSHLISFAEKKTSLDWADLAALTDLHPVLPNGTVSGDFAFAPDSQRLAFFGCEASGNCGLYLENTATRQRSQLLALTFADYLLWKPDGQELGLLGATGQQQNWQYMVVDAHSGQVSYRGEFNWSSLDAGPDSPTHSWHGTSQFQIGGLEACIEPPASPSPVPAAPVSTP